MDAIFSRFTPSFVHRFLISSPDLRIDACFSRFIPFCVHRFLISSPDLEIDASFSRFTPSFVHRFLISSPDLRIDACFSRFIPFCVHRFLISSPDLEIDASFSRFTPSFVHRFLISSPDLRIDARFTPETSFCVHRFLISGSNLGINAAEKSSACSGRSGNEVRVQFYSSLPQRRMVPPAVVVAATMSASDSILRCRKGEWFRLQWSLRRRGPRPILFFASAKENGSVCRSHRDKEEWPACRKVLGCRRGQDAMKAA